MEEETKKNADAIGRIVLGNCETRGKQQNRVTGSGGMLIGRVAQVGSKYKGPLKLKKGDRIATLISLTLTPLHLESIEKVHLATHQIEVKGHAILFESSIAAALPKDISESVAMAAYDVCGAPATVSALVQKGKTLVVIGAGGKAGLLSCVAGRRKLGKSGKIIAIEPFARAAEELRSLKVCDAVLEIDATNPIEVMEAVEKATKGKKADFVINVASVANTEMGAVLAAKPKGTVYFFSMATSFTRVALGAEGIASNTKLLFGNGYYPNHAKFAIDCLRGHKGLRELFQRRYFAP
jgi:L-erythro-3,5-diaminohexanoate dehydrogenase